MCVMRGGARRRSVDRRTAAAPERRSLAFVRVCRHCCGCQGPELPGLAARPYGGKAVSGARVIGRAAHAAPAAQCPNSPSFSRTMRLIFYM